MLEDTCQEGDNRPDKCTYHVQNGQIDICRKELKP